MKIKYNFKIKVAFFNVFRLIGTLKLFVDFLGINTC